MQRGGNCLCSDFAGPVTYGQFGRTNFLYILSEGVIDNLY